MADWAASPSATSRANAFCVSGHQPERVHYYRDANGAVVGAVARFSPGTLDSKKKTFRQFRFDDGKWTAGLGGRRLPLFNLPEVVAAVRERQQVFLVEGELCAELLSAKGAVATTNPGGASKWHSSYTKALVGGHVALIADNDNPGRNHMQMVAEALHGVVAALKWIPTPGLPEHEADEGWDIGNWLEAGGALSVLKELTEATPLWKPRVTAEEDWPAPIPFAASSDPAVFPLCQALPTSLADFAIAVAESVQVDVTAPAALIGAVLSAAAGNAYCVRVSPNHVEPNLSRYLLWAKPSGERGSATFARMLQPLNDWVAAATPAYNERLQAVEAESEYCRKRAQHFERLAAKAKDHSAAETPRAEALKARLSIPSRPRMPLLMVGDTTSEALVLRMAAQGGGLAVMSADARHVLDEVLGRYRSDGKTDDSVYLRAHGGDPIDRSRVGGTAGGVLVNIERPSLALALGVQPDKIAEAARRTELTASGFLPRCNVIGPHSLVGSRIEKGDERPPDPQLIERWSRVVRAIVDQRFRIVQEQLSHQWGVVELALSPEASEARRAFANELERNQAAGRPLHELPGFASKAAGEAARLAALLHLFDLGLAERLANASGEPIPLKTWQCAEATHRFQLPETLRVLGLAREPSQARAARRLLDWIAKEPTLRRVLGTREVIASRIVENTHEATSLLDWLAERGWTRRLPRESAATPRWQVHPAALARGSA